MKVNLSTFAGEKFTPEIKTLGSSPLESDPATQAEYNNWLDQFLGSVNDFSKLSAESEISALAKIQPQEIEP